MSHRTKSVLLGLLLPFTSPPRAEAASPIDCNCMSNLPALQVTCPGIVPDLCAIATNCFSTNLLAGSCIQTLAPGMQLVVGNYVIQLNVMDVQSNSYSCAVPFTVVPPMPAPSLTLSCAPDKTVECGSGWSFDPPTVLSSCCGVSMPATDNVISNGVCSQVIKRTWQVMDGCGNVKSCSQTVTTVDTTPPGTQCGMNLVPNWNFENYTNCPNANSQFNFAAPWFTPTDGTSDYYNSCAGLGSFVTTPTNTVGVQTPLSGQGYAGAVVWSVYGLNPTNTYRNYREYLEVPLLATLTPGQKYQVSFHVSRADNCRYAIAELGARFSSGPLVNYGFYTNFNVVPQAENPSTNLLASASSWMLVQGTFTAIGFESHLTIGNFRTDAATTYVTNNSAGQFPDYAYYYFDDVSVVALCDPSMTNKTVVCGSAWAFDPFPIFDSCSGGNVSVSSTWATNGFCPRVITRTWLLADQCGNSNTLTQTVTIVDTNPPILLCATGANLAPNPQFENYSYCPFFFSQVDAAVPWFNPTVATPDYMNTCSGFWPVSVPNNLTGSQTPFSGQGYVGAFVYSSNAVIFVAPGGYREYVEAPLLAPLVGGVTYQVSFRVSLADYSAWAISEIGAHFSAGPILSGATQGVLNYIPQVVNPSANLLTSTNGWMLVQGTFVAAGGEDHITLGNFRTDANTTAVPAAGTNQAYYYYDDVSVVALCNGFTNKIVPCGEAWNFDTPLAFDVCSGDSVSVSVASTITNGACPRVATRSWIITDACGNSITTTQSVTVVDATPPMLVCPSVNLVPNPGFESYTSCPTNPANTANAAPWYAPSDGTSDFFNACATLGSTVSVPTNFPGIQNAFSGQGYGGAFLYQPGGANATSSYREYLQTPLLAPLVAGQSYTVSFYVNRSDNYAWAIAEIGAHFSVGPMLNNVGPGAPVFPVTPQVENPSTNLLTSTNAWMLVQGTFTAAGGENYLTLGNFRSAAATTAALGNGPYNIYAYYYFDEVSVVAGCPPANKIVPCGSPWSFDQPTGFDQCSGSNVTVSIVSTITNSLCPLNVKRTWTLTDLCGNSNVWSQTVSFLNSTSLVVDCACLQDTSIPLLTTNGCSGIVPNLSILSNSPCISGGCGSVHVTQSPPAGTVLGPGFHSITVNIYDCSGNTNTCVLPYFVNAAPPTIICPPNLILLTCNTGVVANFAPTAIGNTGPIVCSPPSGTIFPLGNNVVTCTATNSCGAVATCSFIVSVRVPYTRWGCIIYAIGIEIVPIGNTAVTYLATLPGGGIGVDFGNLGGTGQHGMRLVPGPAEKFTFNTVLDFNAADGASLNLALPSDSSHPNGTPLVNFTFHNSSGHWDIKGSRQMVADTAAMFRSIAIGTNGELFSSFTFDGANLDTNILASLLPMAGATNAQLTVTLDFHTRGVTLEFPSCTWTPNVARKGWDGCIYGNRPPRGSSGEKTAKLILTPLTTVTSPPITALDLLTSNLTTIAFDNPSITASGRKWGDGHVTLMKAYDDGSEVGLEAVSFGEGGGVHVGLGQAAGFQFRIAQLATNPVPNPEEIFRVKGWPPGTTTNRPPPPVINVRLAHSSTGTGIDCSADFAEWGVSKVTLQLWNGTTLVAEKVHVSATLASPLVTLGGFPGIVGCPGVGVVSLSDTNPIFVLSGLPCPTTGCVGTELRILPEFTTTSTPPAAFTELECLLSEGMDNLIYRLETMPACAPVPLDATATPDGIHLNWDGDGFHLEGAESLGGPWYDLGVSPPVTLPANSSVRVFRLRCE